MKRHEIRLRREAAMLSLLWLFAGTIPVTAQELPPADALPETTVEPRGPVPLDGAIAIAIATYPSIDAAKARAEAAGADLRAAKWLRFASLSIEGQALDTRNDRWTTSAIVDQPVWAGGRINASIDRASQQRTAALAEVDEAVQQVALNVAQAYVDYVRFARREDVLRDSQREHRRMVETMERRVQAEVSPLSDMELARSRAAQVEQQLAATASAKLTALQRLSELVGQPGYRPDHTVTLAGAMPIADLDDLIAQAMEFDPRRRRLKAQSGVAAAEARLQQAQILPQVSLRYSYNEIGRHQVGVVMKAQSEGGLSRFAAAQGARLREQSSALEVATGDRELRERVVADYVEYQSAIARVSASTQSAAAAVRVRESYMRQFTSARRSWLDVMNAVREATSAQVDAIEAETSAYASQYRLLLRTGQWQPSGEVQAP